MGGREEAAKVVWNPKEEKFETEDKESFLQYHLRHIRSASPKQNTNKNKTVVVMDMVHTYVPRSKRGQGLAATLCTAAFQHARDRSLPVIPTCTYISDTFLPRNPSWSSIVYANDVASSSM